jgi:hypothetical protein
MLSTATRNSLLAVLAGQGGPGAPFLPLGGDDLCGGRKCLSDEDLQIPQEAKGSQASYDLAPGLLPRQGSKELKKGRMEWVLYPPRGGSPARIQIIFTPKASHGSQTVTFLQTLLETRSSTIAAPPDKTVLDFRRDIEEPEPFYGAEWEQGRNDWIAESVRTPPPAGFRNAPTSSTEASASLYDQPVVFPGMGRIFESVAVIPETAEVLGSLRWGVVGDTILGAQDEDCTDLPTAGFDATMKAYYTPPSGGGFGGPEHFDAVIDGYAAGGFELSIENQKQLDPVIKKFLDYPNTPNRTQIAVSGFGDANEEDPVFASEMRALIVMRYLVSNGVPETNIDIHSFGKAWARFPVSPSEVRNRRVQVRTYYK